MKKPSNHPCSQQIGQIIYEGIEEIVGEVDSSLLFQQAEFPLQNSGCNELSANEPLVYRNLSKLIEVIEKNYGLKGAQGIEWKAGRASFKKIADMYGRQMGFSNLEYHLLPTPLRLKTGLQELAKTLSDLWDEPIQVFEDQTAWYWQIEHSPWCWERQSQEASCYFTVGLVQEFLSWASGGKYYTVTETMCAAAGQECCAIQINKRALE